MEEKAAETFYEENVNIHSNMEGLAAQAERDSIKYMQVKYMQDHKDKSFWV
jgi:ribonuclease R/exosome complex exonuclease DIS3/RRP44